MHHFRRVLVCAFASCLLVLGSAAPAHGADGDDLDLAAGWLAHSLAANDGLAVAPMGGTDYASTAYALIGLRAAGVAGQQITTSATAMATSGDSFIGDPGQADDKATAIALMILAMSAADLNPAMYAGSTGVRNLYADLESAIHEDGSISSMPSAYGQSYAILALLGSPDGVPDKVIGWLLAQPCTDSSSEGYGGYGFSGPGSCTDADPDSTALAVIALAAAGVSPDTLGPARTFLMSVQDGSGGFASPFSGINANTTGLAVAALNAVAPGSPEIARAKDFLSSLMYGCDQTGASTTDLVGAIALDADSRATITEQDRNLLFQASAQGIYGFIDKAVSPDKYGALSQEAPSTGCPVPLTSGISSGWLWGIGGFLVIVLVYIAWRFLISSRKS